jgi:hypothetical protein
VRGGLIVPSLPSDKCRAARDYMRGQNAMQPRRNSLARSRPFARSRSSRGTAGTPRAAAAYRGQSRDTRRHEAHPTRRCARRREVHRP